MCIRDRTKKGRIAQLQELTEKMQRNKITTPQIDKSGSKPEVSLAEQDQKNAQKEEEKEAKIKQSVFASASAVLSVPEAASILRQQAEAQEKAEKAEEAEAPPVFDVFDDLNTDPHGKRGGKRSRKNRKHKK